MNRITSNLILFQAHLNTKSDFALYENLRNVNARSAHKSMRKVIERLTTPIESETKDTALVGPYKLGVTKRANANVIAISALVFDIDKPKGLIFDDIFNLVSDYSGVLHTTWSHTTEEPRYRLTINLSEQIPAKDYESVRDNFLFCNPELNEVIDHACSDISRAYYLFSYPHERADMAQCCVLMGAPINPKQFITPILCSEITQYPNKQVPISADQIIQEGNRNRSLCSYLGQLINKNLSKEETFALVTKWNEALANPLPENEVGRTHDSIWKTHQRNNLTTIINHKLDQISDLFNVIPASKLLDTPPPPRKWVINEFMPKEIVASIIAAGGTGKSFLAMHIATCIATGTSLFGKFSPPKAGKVVFISGEDDYAELQRRLHKVTKYMSPAMKDLSGKNLVFIDLADVFELFTSKPNHGEIEITNVPLRICDSIRKHTNDDIAMVIIDPISRFRGGEENLAVDTTRFVQSLQIIRNELKTTVLTLHHVNKGAKTNGNSQNNARGSSAFIDGVRLVYELNLLSEEEIKKRFGVIDNPTPMLTLNSVKSNYGKSIDPLVLSRQDDGTLEGQAFLPKEYQAKSLLLEIKANKLSKTKFKETHGSVKGKFGLSEKALLQKLSELESQGLINIPQRGNMVVTEAGNQLLLKLQTGN